LPDAERAKYVREHRAKHARMHELVGQEQKREWISALQMGLVLAGADIVSAHGSSVTIVLALVVGAALGWASMRLSANEVVTGATTLGVFFVLELITRRGVSATQLFVCFPVGFIAAWLTWRRQDHGI
jgi:hypothetical protein